MLTALLLLLVVTTYGSIKALLRLYKALVRLY
jgi:hypothetical protein